MRNWQTIAENLIERFKPESDSSLFHYDGELGAVLINFVEGITEGELADYTSATIQWRTTSFAGLLYLVHSVPGRSWNDTPVSLFADAEALQSLASLEITELPLTYLVLDADGGRLLAIRDCLLDASVTSELQAGLRLQEEIGLDALIDAEKLASSADPTTELEAPGLPKIISVKVDEEKRRTVFGVKSPVQQEKDEPRPRWLLRSVAANPMIDFKGYEQSVARYSSFGERPDWLYCFFPVDQIQNAELEKQEMALNGQLAKLGITGAEARTYIEDALQEHRSSVFPYVYLAMMLSWRQGQGIYRFDPELLKTLFLTALPGHLNPKIFTRLPEFCVYIETPGIKTLDGIPVHGFFAMAEGQMVLDQAFELQEERWLYILLDVADSPAGLSRQRLFVISLDPSTLSDALNSIEEITNHGLRTATELASWFSPLLSQLLYLCSDEPEILSQSGPRQETGKPTPTKTRKGYRIFVPSTPTIWACGWRLGALIRRAKEELTEQRTVEPSSVRASPRGHVRRAHWHLFWAGKKTADVREPRIKYLPMLKVNLKEKGEELPAVIRRVSA